jgi:hypothetical protein
MDEAPDMIKKERLYLSNIIREEVAAANQMIINQAITYCCRDMLSKLR